MWHAVYKPDTGELVSLTTERPRALRAGLEAKEVGEIPHRPVWDESTRTLGTRPEPVPTIRNVVAEIAGHAAMEPFVSRLTQEQRKAFAAALKTALSDFGIPEELKR